MDLIVQLHTTIQNTIVLITHDPEVAELSRRSYKVADKGLILVSQK